MGKKLVVVESPTKARTIGRFLGPDVQVQASMGHVRDLPQKILGVDVNNNFTPNYELTPSGRKIVRSLRQAAASAEDIYLATDHDREGEAIAWHLQEILQDAGQARFHRITFHEITQSAIQKSFANPGVIAEDLVAAQQARRVLDRLVGYQVSPLLWRHVKKGTSAGRVQSVALRLVVEREREIQAFTPQEYRNLDAWFESRDPKAKVKTRLTRINDSKVLVSNADDATRLADALQSPGVAHQVVKVQSTPRRKTPPPPFITSTLQQAAGSALKISATQTMRIAQELYEGIELGSGGPVGLITYMRTDSVNIAREAQTQALDFIAKNYGREYAPARPNAYRSRKSAQEAHEAIRPTDVTHTPDRVAPYLTPQQAKIYRLIWNRFVASQMVPAQQVDHVIEIESTGGALDGMSATSLIQTDNAAPARKSAIAAPGVACLFHAAARETVFPGYLVVYNIKEVGEEDDPADTAKALPDLQVGAVCDLLELTREQCFTNPPNRYSEASLVKALEQNGVGRPSTYASTVNTIQERDYVNRDKGSLIPTELGFATNDFLVQQMPHLFDIGFTAEMESELDQVEEGKLNWTSMLADFYQKLQQAIGAKPGVSQACTKENLQAILALFPDGFTFDPPVVRGRRTYDDAKFMASIADQTRAEKTLTDRQWTALLNLVAKYGAKSPELVAAMDGAGLGEVIRPYMADQEKANREAAEAPKPPPAQLELLEAMSTMTWNEPVKRGKRVYDDGKFFRSLYERVQNGGALSPAQSSALLKLAANYAAIIPNYQALAQALGAAEPAEATDDKPPVAPALSEADRQKIDALVAMSAEIKTWKTPKPGGRRTFDDQDFVQSVVTQYRQKGSLSERQVAALGKVVSKYPEQIKDYAQRAKAAGIGEPPPPPKLLKETCPQCGAPLITRSSRGRTFTGCSAFPKCRYIAK
jgi:DNA topoisomerase-1